MPRPLKFHTPKRRGVRLLLEEKLPIITIGRYDAVTFDLIRSGLSRTTVVEV